MQVLVEQLDDQGSGCIHRFVSQVELITRLAVDGSGSAGEGSHFDLLITVFTLQPYL